MNKNEFINAIQQSINTEETATTVYLKHLKAIMTRSGLDPVKISRIQKAINDLIRENMYHKNMLESILTEIEKEDCNDF